MSDDFNERYRLLLEEWVRADGEARMLEEMRRSVRAEIANQARQGGASATAAEQEAEGSQRYRDHVRQMVEKRTQANLLKARADAMQMKWETWRTRSATKRAEMRL